MVIEFAQGKAAPSEVAAKYVLNVVVVVAVRHDASYRFLCACTDSNCGMAQQLQAIVDVFGIIPSVLVVVL